MRAPVGRIALLLTLGVGVWVLLRGEGEPKFRPLASGVEFTRLSGQPYCRQGSPEIALLRIDPRQVRLRVHHCFREPDAQPLDAVGWQRRTGALAVFNAGQYYPDLSYMGLFVSRGVPVSRKLHPTFKAALVASPEGGGHDARVLDLDEVSLNERRPGWREVAQSFMVLDRAGRIRVRKTAQVAQRTIVAEDDSHRILVFTTEGGYTLYDFAQLLRSANLHVTHAMSMDGGNEAQMVVLSGDFRYASFGPWNPDDASAELPLPLLPAVVSVEVE